MNVVENMRAARILRIAEEGGYFDETVAAMRKVQEDKTLTTEIADSLGRCVLEHAADLARALLDPAFPGVVVVARLAAWKNARHKFHFTLIGGTNEEQPCQKK